MFRRQLPAYSPIQFQGVMHGVLAGLLGGRAEDHDAVSTWIAERFGTSNMLFTDSGTTALALAVRLAAEQNSGAPAALPAYSCFDIATAVDAVNVPVLLYDLDPRTLAPDMESLQRVLEQGAGAVVVAHLYGFPCDMPAIIGCASRYGAVIFKRT